MHLEMQWHMEKLLVASLWISFGMTWFANIWYCKNESVTGSNAFKQKKPFARNAK
jgi:hypothetical protein